MQNKDSLINELETVNSFHEFTQVYQEISVMRMQRIRERVLRNREFQHKLAEIYYDVKHSYENEVLKIELKKKNKKNLGIFTKKKKSVAIFLTSSGRLYGDIFRQVFTIFRHYVTTQEVEIIIIGRLGKQMYEDFGLEKKYTYFELPDREVKYDDLLQITSYLVDYDNINVFYGRFENIVTQKGDVSNITGDTVEEVKTTVASDQFKPDSKDLKRFLFEPSLENVLHFFDTQVFASLFKQAIHESDLARFASRIQAMEKASSSTETLIKTLSGDLMRMNKLMNNKKQLERISGITMWNT